MVKKVNFEESPAISVNEPKKKAATKKTTAKKAVKKELKPEEGVVILACINQGFLEKMNKLAEKEGVKLVITNEQVIYDYIEAKSVEVDESARMTAFLKDERNRKLAQEHAKEMWRILSCGKSMDKAKDVVFEKKSLVKATTLSWTKAEEMLNTLEGFGFVKRISKTEFTFLFDLKMIREHIKNQVTLSVESLNLDIERYKGAVEESSDIDEKDKEKFLSEFNSEVTRNIVF